MTDDVTVIVLDLNGGPMLAACLASIAAQTVLARVIVFDNGGGAAAAPAAVKILRSETNLGFTGGVNAAYQHVTTPFVALINNDVVLDPDWLATVRNAMKDGIAAVQTILRKDEDTIDGAGISIADGTFRQITSGEAWGVSATAALYRREALGGRVFDPRFFAYYEDVELCARLREAGWGMVVVQETKATHLGSRTAPALPHARRLRARNRYWVARMHPGVGRVGALLWEDAKLLPRGRSSLRGIIEGLCSRLS